MSNDDLDHLAPMLVCLLSLGVIFNSLSIYFIIRLVKVWH